MTIDVVFCAMIGPEIQKIFKYENNCDEFIEKENKKFGMIMYRKKEYILY